MKKLILPILIGILFASCHKTQGCTDASATNFDASADVSAGCTFSDATFYAQYSTYNGIPIVEVDVAVGGDNIGSTTTYFPSGPGNCSAPGTLSYHFLDDKSVDWNSTVHLANGQIIYGSGTVAPSGLDCVKVNVTR